MKKKAALYVRVSTSHQVDKDSLPFQRQELQNYAKYVLGIDDFVLFQDAGYSAKNTDRPDYQNMILRIKSREFSHLLVWKIDRISRNLKDFTEMYEDLKKYGVTFISKNEQFDTSTAMGDAMLKITLVFAELERNMTSERVKSIMLDRASKGIWNGARVPLGYKRIGKEFPTVDEHEASIVNYVFDSYIKLSSTTKVAQRLNSEHILTKSGSKWTGKTVNDLLRNPFYIGTYRYNHRVSKTARIKAESEWIIVENNHLGIVSPEKFEKVNNMLTNNYRGNGTFQRENTHTHIFARSLICGKCGASLIAGQDVARKDGYRPSRYTCYSSRKYNEHSVGRCNNFISDITLLPFVLSYISNFINLYNRIDKQHSARDVERTLLRGSSFVDVAGIDNNGLYGVLNSISGENRTPDYKEKSATEPAFNMALETLKREKQKFEKALTRLEDLYLFSEEAMSEKDFIFKKRDIVANIERINSELSELHKTSSDHRITFDTAFLSKVSNFVILNELSTRRTFDFKELLNIVSTDEIKEFVNSVVTEIVVQDKKVLSITLANGIKTHFAYRLPEEQKIRTREKFLYRSYEPMLLDYFKNHDSISRHEAEILTGMSRGACLSILTEFMDRGILIKKGNSVASRYYLTEKNPHES